MAQAPKDQQRCPSSIGSALANATPQQTALAIAFAKAQQAKIAALSTPEHDNQNPKTPES
jgi:hypothetical protein